MPEDSKKSHHKGKHDAKEQRKPRQQRQHGAEKSEKKMEKKHEEPKVPAPKPSFVEPGPEFYKGLKRETDEILKITEEANAKYKKKEIQSNWTKYEMPIESYEQIDEQENLGADYEKLIQAPMSAGGHFQFKHEKNWDINTGPSLYDKYFEINMDNLATAISTMPFYERMNMDQTVFSETDITSMNTRAVKYKRKYYNDKSYTTAELGSQEAILNNLKESLKSEDKDLRAKTVSECADIVLEASSKVSTAIEPENKIENTNESKTVDITKTKLPSPEMNRNNINNEINKEIEPEKIQNNDIDELDEILSNTKIESDISKIVDPKDNETTSVMAHLPTTQLPTQAKVADNHPKESNPVIESPEDLEKWLDDFLDG
ncbi:hypothetical protein O0L34_g13586 [Tuta absoluta]|nr:hypothetical protein O0L34_g13586 [Tuta absoluta]